MKAPKNRTKLLRVACGMCKATQDALNAQCAHCGNPLYTNMSPEELTQVRDLVEGIETRLAVIESGEKAKGNPYAVYDEARERLRLLRAYAYIPGMNDYLAAARKVILPYQIRMMENTIRANIIFSVVLIAFALVPLLLGWPLMVSALMLMPALVWVGVTIRAWNSLKTARSQLRA